MILDNLSRALRTQNWLAAGMEFVIVIAGVVIGFQINAWATGRALAEREAALLDRLHDEVEASVHQIQRMVTLYDGRNAQRTEAIERLIARDFEDMDQEAMTSGVISTALFPAFSAPEGVYTEIVSAGMLSGLGDERFRAALGAYRSEVTFLRGQIDYLRSVSNARELPVDTPHVRQVYAPDTPRQLNYTVDWMAAAQDAEFLQTLLVGNNLIRAIAGWWDNALTQAEALCAETSRLTGRPCEPVESAGP